ncbi:hypothetical protein ACFV3R_06610 [Streptomyces sp. NPDC059740]|uniref:hypothetical protein n=1 Tax=Streptomyces sp. NPDC059740 TaxID=3346926 RepID=UPI00366015C6
MLTASTLLILLAAAGYALLCAARPFALCRRCSGTGIRTTRSILRREQVKLCRRCRGKRYRLRIGRRLTNHARRLHTAGTRPTPTHEETLPWQ